MNFACHLIVLFEPQIANSPKEAFNAVFLRWVTDIGDLIAMNPKEFFDWLHSDVTATRTV
jgi:hypothetical protein